MAAHRVLRLHALFDSAGVQCWLDGGWGVDALVGRQTREHGDLDLVVEAQGMATAMQILTDNGYLVTRDWLPTAIAFRHSDGGEADLHPVVRAADGGGDQVQLDGKTNFHYHAPVQGVIAGSPVQCCSLEDQLACHLGYEATDKDRGDVALLARTFAVAIPAPYVRAHRRT